MLFFFFFFAFLGPHPQHMEVPRLGVKSELQLLPTPQPQQRQICTRSLTYSTAHSNTGPLTHWVRPGIDWTGILMDTDQVPYHWATTGTPRMWFLKAVGHRSSSSSSFKITWELVRDVNSWAPPRPSQSEALGVGPSVLSPPGDRVAYSSWGNPV